MRQSKSQRRGKKDPPKIRMAPQRVLGICLVIAGIIILAIGAASHKAPVDAATGSGAAGISLSNSWYILGGIGITLFGFILAVLGLRSRTARY